MSAEKFVEYQTEKDFFKDEYRKAWLMTPLLGFGFLKLVELNKKVDSLRYRVYNDKITTVVNQQEKTILFENLKTIVKKSDSNLDRMGIATIIVEDLEGNTIEMKGIKGADKLEKALIVALETEKKKRALKEKAKGDYDNYKIGGLEHMNSLVGMWQQGLISDEDFRKEQEKFKKNA